jgi:hypothetical protein
MKRENPKTAAEVFTNKQAFIEDSLLNQRIVYNHVGRR